MDLRRSQVAAEHRVAADRLTRLSGLKILGVEITLLKESLDEVVADRKATVFCSRYAQMSIQHEIRKKRGEIFRFTESKC